MAWAIVSRSDALKLASLALSPSQIAPLVRLGVAKAGENEEAAN